MPDTTRAKVSRAVWRAGVAASGDLLGRAVNLSLPFILLSTGAQLGQLDAFFLALAVAFFAQGTLANAIALALLPTLVAGTGDRGLQIFAAVGVAAGAVTAVTFAILSDTHDGLELIIQVTAVSLMAASGIVAAPAVAALHSDHRYLLPGLTWGLRLAPILLHVLSHEEPRSLTLLLAAIAIADVIRTGILVRYAGRSFALTGSTPLTVPRSALYLVLGSAIAGLTPLVARWAASTGGTGALTYFEVADRLYSAIAALATLGVGNVTAVYLARLQGTREDRWGWNWILKASAAWSMLWILFSFALATVLPTALSHISPAGQVDVDVVRHTFLALAIGLPAIILSNVMGRRLLMRGHSATLMWIAILGLVSAAILAPIWEVQHGTAGVGAAVSVVQYLAVAVMAFKLIRSGQTPGLTSRRDVT